jgi:hypothetical protein
MWLCRGCAEVWPCPTARLKLKAEYGDDRASLCVYLINRTSPAGSGRCDPGSREPSTWIANPSPSGSG